MSAITPRQFAKLSQLTLQLHEDSFSLMKGDYTKTWDECAAQACTKLGLDKEWAWLAQFINWTGYCDVGDWCEKQLGEKP